MKRGTWEWWRARHFRRKERHHQFDDVWPQIVDQMDDLDEERERNRAQDHADILAAGYVVGEDGRYARTDRPPQATPEVVSDGAASGVAPHVTQRQEETP